MSDDFDKVAFSLAMGGVLLTSVVAVKLVERHGATKDDPTRGAAILFVDMRRRRVLLLRRSETDPWRPGWWCLPGGTSQRWEWASTTAVREAKEEVGLHPVTWMFVEDTVIDGYKLSFFACNRWEGEITLDYEHDRYLWVPFWDVIDHTGVVKAEGMQLLPGVAEALESLLNQLDDHSPDRPAHRFVPYRDSQREEWERSPWD